MRNSEELLKLFERIAQGEATEEDIIEYNRWCNAFQERDIAAPETGRIAREMWRDIRKRIHPRAGIARPAFRARIAVAASALLIVISGGYYLLHRESRQPIASVRPNDISPGSNKAVLTLANGKSIILDDAHKGQLADQGNSRVIKMDSGLLAYTQMKISGKNFSPAPFNTVTVPKGGQYQVLLPDGTKVWLNAASSIRFPTAFTGKERRVSVTGETYMEVAEDVNRPFMVETRRVEVMVLGTHFNIMAYSDEPAVKTTLLEGAVKVMVYGGQAEAVIRPGQQAIAGNGDGKIDVKKVDATDVAAWTHGFLSLKDCSVREFMNQLSRWYDVDIRYAGKIPDRRLGGMINRNAPLSDMLSALRAAGIRTRLEGNKIIILSN